MIDETRAAHGARAQVNEVEVSRGDRPRRYTCTWVKRRPGSSSETPRRVERREHRRRAAAASGPQTGLASANQDLEASRIHSGSRARRFVVADPLAPGEKRVGELGRVEPRVAHDVLEPLRRVASRALQLQHLDLSRAPGTSANASARSGGPPRSRSASTIASSSASLVPEPIEKCAVWAESPRSTTLSWNQRLVAHARKREPRRFLSEMERRYPSARCRRGSQRRRFSQEAVALRFRHLVDAQRAPRLARCTSTMNVLVSSSKR